MSNILAEDVIPRDKPSDGNGLFSPEGIGLLLLTSVSIYIVGTASSKRPFSRQPDFTDCLIGSLVTTPFISLITLIIMLIIPPLHDYFLLTYCIVLWVYLWIDHYHNQKKLQARMSPVCRTTPLPDSSNYLTAPTTAKPPLAESPAPQASVGTSLPESPTLQMTAEASLAESPAPQASVSVSSPEASAPQASVGASLPEQNAPQGAAEASPAEQNPPDTPLRPRHTSRTRRLPRRDKHR